MSALSEQEEEMLWEAMKHETELRDLVTACPGREKIRRVRAWLRERFPEVIDLPRIENPRNSWEAVSPEFKIAKTIVGLLS